MAQVVKDGSGRITKKTVIQGLTYSNIFTNTPFLSSPHAILFNNRNFNPSIPVITSSVTGSEQNSTSKSTGTLSQAILSKLDNVTPGQAAAGKALVLDSNKVANGINILKCNSLVANGVNIATEVGDPSSIVVANDYFVDNIPGTATAGKAVVLNSGKNISIKKINGTADDNYSITEGKYKNITTDFQLTTNLSDGKWYDVIYSVDLQKFLAIGSEMVATSSTGSSWTEYAKPGIDFTKAIWVSNLGKYLAVAMDGLYESSDGVDWTKTIVSVGIVDVSVGSEKIVAFNSTTIFSKGLKDLTWVETAMTTEMTAISWKSISYGKNAVCSSRFIVVGTNNMCYCLETNIATAENWTTVALTGNWISVAYGNEVFIAVNGTAQAINKYTVSCNGVTWFAGNLTFRDMEVGSSLVGFRSVKYLKGVKIFFIMPIASDSTVLYTPSGNELYYMKHPTSGTLMGIDYSPVDKKIVAVSSNVDVSLDTSLVATLTPRKIPIKQFRNDLGFWQNNYALFSFSNSVNESILYVSTSSGLLYSLDGDNFTKCFVSRNGGNLFDQVDRQINCIIFVPSLSKYFACTTFSSTDGYKNAMSSIDGVNWVDITVGTGFGDISWLAYSTLHSRIYAVGGNRLYYSTDGVTWSFQTYYSGYWISNVEIEGTETIILHGSHSSKTYHILNSDLTYTAIPYSSYGFRAIVKFNNAYYAVNGSSIFKSIDNCNNWVEDVNLGASNTSICYHPIFNCLVCYTTNNKLAILKTTGAWAVTIINTQNVRYTQTIAYFSKNKSIYMASNMHQNSIMKTLDHKSCIISAEDIYGEDKIWKTLPDMSLVNREINDNIISAFRNNTSTRSVTFTVQASEPLWNLVYSRWLKSWIIQRAYSITRNNGSIVSLDEFVSNTQNTIYAELVDTDFGMYYISDGTYSSGSFTSCNRRIQSYNLYSNTNSIASEASGTYSLLLSTSFNYPLKYCREIKCFYRISAANSLTLHYVQKTASTTASYYSETITFTGSPSASIDAVICKERNLCVYISNSASVRRATTVNLLNTNNFLYNITLPVKTYLRVEYHYDAKMFIILATDTVFYSADGAVWTESPTVFTGYTFKYQSMKYIPELNVMGLAGNGMFAFTRNGITWTMMTTSTIKTWFTFDYNPFQSRICLLSDDGVVFVSGPVHATAMNVVVPSNSFMSKDKLYMFNGGSHYPAETQFTLNTSHGIFTKMNTKEFNIYEDWNETKLITGGILRIEQFDSNAVASRYLSIQGKYIEGSPKLFDSLKTNMNNIYNERSRQENITKSGLKLLQAGGSLSVNGLYTDNIAVSGDALVYSNHGDMGLVVADNDKNVAIAKLSLSELKVNGTIISNSSARVTSNIPHQAPFLPLDRYLKFKRNVLINGKQNSNIMGSSYSPELNVLVLYANPNSSQISQCFYVSNDKGNTWFTVGINNGASFTVNQAFYTCKIKWLSSLSVFCLAQNNNIMISYDGYNWMDNNISFGNNPSLFWDSKLNRLTVLAENRIAFPISSNLLSGWTVLPQTNYINMAEYYQPLDLYFFRDNNTNFIKSTADIYAVTITSVSTVDNSVVSDMTVWNGFVYYLSTSAVLRRNIAGTTAGTTVFTMNGTPKRLVSLTIADNINLLVVFSTTTYAYTIDGTTWYQILYSNELMPSYVDTTADHMMNNLMWTGDRLVMILNSDGLVLESDLEESVQESSIKYLKDLITTQTTHNRLLTHTKQSDIIIRHSAVPVNMYATAYGNGLYVTVGENSFVVSTSLKKNQFISAHAGGWRDVIYHSASNQFIKVGSGIIAYSLSTSASTWIDIATPAGDWASIISLDSTIYLFEAGVAAKCKYATVTSGSVLDENVTWNDITLSTASAGWNGLKMLNNKLFLLGNNYISYMDVGGFAWTNVMLEGIWNDISFGRNMYLVAGNCVVARSMNLSRWFTTPLLKNYHKIVYVRLLSEFYLMNKEVNYFSGTKCKESTNAVVKTMNGVNFYNSLNSYLQGAAPTARLFYYLSNLYYFEESDQFAMPLNNSGNKYYIFSMPFAPRKGNYKITNPQTFNTIGGKIEIARGSSVIAAPSTFNVFQDSAAKPGTSTWITTSDKRFKEDIQPADLDKCWDNVDKLDLKYFKWKDEYIDSTITSDRKKLGWIAQDVEQVIPKAVKKIDMFDIDDCRTLDSDQIIANMFGTVKLLLKKLKEKEEAVFN